MTSLSASGTGPATVFDPHTTPGIDRAAAAGLRARRRLPPAWSCRILAIMNDRGITGTGKARGKGPPARAQLEIVFNELTDDQAERALAVLEASADWILTGSPQPAADESSGEKAANDAATQ